MVLREATILMEREKGILITLIALLAAFIGFLGGDFQGANKKRVGQA